MIFMEQCHGIWGCYRGATGVLPYRGGALQGCSHTEAVHYGGGAPSGGVALQGWCLTGVLPHRGGALQGCSHTEAVHYRGGAPSGGGASITSGVLALGGAQYLTRSRIISKNGCLPNLTKHLCTLHSPKPNTRYATTAVLRMSY